MKSKNVLLCLKKGYIPRILLCLFFTVQGFLTFSQNPVIHLPLNGNTLDISGNNLNGINSNATLTTDRFNNPNSAYFFNGNNASIAIPYSNKFNILPGGKFTISLWLQPALGNSICALFVKSPYNSNYYNSLWDYGLYLVANKGMSGYANTNFLVGTTTMVQNACWYHLAVTYDNGNWNLYLNGKLEAWDYSMTKKILQSTGGISLGKKGEADGDFFNGKLDDVKFYDTVLSPGEIKTMTCYAGNDKTICLGDSVQLNGAGVGVPLWSPAYGLSNPNILNPKASPGSTRTYILTLSDGGTCVVRDTTIVTVIVGSINVGPDKTLCEGDSFVFTNTMSGNYTWSPNYAINGVNLQNPTVKPLLSTTYYVSIFNGVCTFKDTIHFNVINISVNAGPDQTLCLGDSIQLHGSFTGNSFAWSPLLYLSNPLTLNPYSKPPATCWYVLTSVNSICTRHDTTLITVVDSVNANAGTDTSLCIGQTIQLNAKGGNSYVWLNPYNLNNPAISNPLIWPQKDTSYIVKVGIGPTCIDFDTIDIKVKPIPTVNAGSDRVHCYNDSIQLSGIVSSATSYLWMPSMGLSNALILNPYASVQTKSFFVLYAQSGDCFNSDTVQVNSMPKVTADFNLNTTTAIVPANIKFYNKSINAFFYSWIFDETGSKSNQENPEYLYSKNGKFIIWLIAKDSLGCTDSIFKTITILPKPFLTIPNVFSPNNDGFNDLFAFDFAENTFEYISYQIYNRWGDLLYETSIPGGTWWNGTYKNIPSPEAVYFYIVEAKDIASKHYNLHGTVTLIR